MVFPEVQLWCSEFELFESQCLSIAKYEVVSVAKLKF